MVSDLPIIFMAYITSFVWQIISWPVLRKLFPQLPDKGWALGRVFSSLLISLVLWNLAYLGLPINTVGGVWLVTIIMLMAVLVYWRSSRSERLSKDSIKLIAIEEYLFLVGFFLMALTRGFAPDIHNLEKFMDYGFVRRYLSSPTLPAEDMWLALNPINYYSFGHFWASVVIRTFRTQLAVGFNLMLAYLAGLGLQLSFWVASNMAATKQRSRMVAGLVGSMAAIIGGNTHTVWYFLSHLSLSGYWYADATRFIYHTIHEFPSYSFVVSDLHGHLLDLPVVLSFLGLLVVWSKTRKSVYEVMMGVLFGVMMMTNTWDVAIYGLVLGVYCLINLIKKEMTWQRVIRTALTMFVSMMVTAGLWWVQFTPISQGIGKVTERSPLWQLLVLWTGGVTASVMAWITSNKGKQKIMTATLLISVLTLLIIPEFIYAKDIYTTYPRANTMFKLTYQAFVMMGLSLGVAAGQIVGGWKARFSFRAVAGIIVVVIFVSVMMFPVEAFTTYYGNFDTYKGLNGEAWMKQDMPEKFGAIQFLRTNSDGKRMVEAVGDSYTDLNAVSAFSGVPTVLGWRVHEWLWRGGYDVVSQRDEAVKEIYEGTEKNVVKAILTRYDVGWILVGQDERDKYKVQEKVLRSLGTIAWQDNGVYLIKVVY